MDVCQDPVPRRQVKTLQKQWLEELGALHYVLTLCSAPFFVLLLFHLLSTRLWSLSVLYMLWIYLDRNTPSQGGRRWEWPRTWAIWKHQRDYFPIKLVKTAELPPSQNYVLGAHPHGVMCTRAFSNFLTECNNFSRRFLGLQPWLAMMARFFYVLLVREYIMMHAPAGPGGGHHDRGCPGDPIHCLELRNRRGSVCLALRHRSSLVPVYSFGENDTFRCMPFPKRSWQYLCQVTCKRVTSIAPCIFWGHGLFSPSSWGLLPLPMPITIVVGSPIPVPQCSNASEEQVDHYHRLYMDALERLFEEHKESCGVPASTHLTFY